MVPESYKCNLVISSVVFKCTEWEVLCLVLHFLRSLVKKDVMSGWKYDDQQLNITS